VVVLVAWGAALAIYGLDVSTALAEWNRTHEQWAIDDVTLISLVVVAALGVFSWRRWRESQATIDRHRATLERLRTTEGEIASKDQLIRSVSHELRTPLTAILGYASLLSDEDIAAEERAAMVSTIVRQGRDLADIVEDLLTRAQSESNTLQVAAVPVDLAAQAAQVLEGWSPDDRARVEFAPRGAVRAIGDPARVRQIVRNLVSNALRYGTDRVRVEAGVAGEAAWMTVSDDGPGIPPEERERIFDPYHRAATSRTVPGGVGLGLAISRHLAVLMGGSLTCRRDDDCTVFEFTLPTRADRLLAEG
jgi:signal transduction histidine kinase